jgi:hypothetical protein
MGAWSLMSILSKITGLFTGSKPAESPRDADEPASRHDRREAGRKRHHETGEPAWEESDRLDEPPGAGKKDPDSAPEILGGS